MPYFYRNNIKYSGGSDSVDLTMAEYKELEANGKVVQDTTYYIIDADENIPSRPNLLINSNFANPVNQRGITAKTWVVDTYGIDRWVLWNAGAKVSSINSNGITFFNEIGSNNPYGAVLEQRIELSEIEYEKPYTLSACIDGEIYSISTIVKNEQLYSLEILNNVKIEIDARDNRYLNVKIRNYNTTPITVKWAKLELGDHATPYVPRLYAEELQLCQRYYNQIMSTDNSNNWISRTSINGYSLGPTVEFPVEMRVPPTVKIYSNKTGVQGNIVSWHDDGDYGRGNFTAASISCKGFYIVNAEAVTEIGKWYTFNYTADAEL